MDPLTTPPRFIDSHCHLADQAFAGKLTAIIQAARGAGVTHFVVPAVEPGEWQRLQNLLAWHDQLLPAFGLHPMHSQLFSPEILKELASYHSAVAIGEIGLDYSLAIPREVQRHAFRIQLRHALHLDLPVLIHCRNAFQDLMTILAEEGRGPIRGVMHAFSGSVETAVQCIKRGLYISLAGTVTFANAVRPLAVAKAIPLDSLLLESDAPDLSPEPYRGLQNEPAFLPATARKVAEIKGVSLEEVAACTRHNTIELFRLPL